MTEPTKDNEGFSDAAYELARTLMRPSDAAGLGSAFDHFGPRDTLCVSVYGLARALDAFAAQRVAEVETRTLEKCAKVLAAYQMDLKETKDAAHAISVLGIAIDLFRGIAETRR